MAERDSGHPALPGGEGLGAAAFGDHLHCRRLVQRASGVRRGYLAHAVAEYEPRPNAARRQ